jgi:hypothetical protein
VRPEPSGITVLTSKRERSVRTRNCLPAPASVEIQSADGAFFLLYLNEHGECLTDTWHQTLEQAKAQARHEFGIGEDAWESLRT